MSPGSLRKETGFFRTTVCGHAARRRTVRVIITLVCTECRQRNYNTTKNKRTTPDKLEFRKYCRFCRKHTPHREGK